MALANHLGLSVKVVSERHFYASQQKATAGAAAKEISKKLKIKVSAKEAVAAYKLLNGSEPEWHHSGFYKKTGYKSTMGRTFFFSQNQIDDLIARWPELAEHQAAVEREAERARVTMVSGIYYWWDSDSCGRYGKKVNHKVLGVYEGPQRNCPHNFTPASPAQVACAKLFVGQKYYGWDEPKLGEFTIASKNNSTNAVPEFDKAEVNPEEYVAGDQQLISNATTNELNHCLVEE